MASNSEALPVSGAMCGVEPFLEPLAFALLDDIRAFFKTQEGEAEYQAWLEDPEKVRRAWDEKNGRTEHEGCDCVLCGRA